MVVTTLERKKIGALKSKDNRLFILDKSQEFQRYIVKQQEHFFIHIANCIKNNNHE